MNNFNLLYDTIIKATKEADTASRMLRIQNMDKGLRASFGIIKNLETIMEVMVNLQEDSFENGIQIDVNMLLAILEELLNAQESRDYILLADLYDFRLIPYLLEIQPQLIEVIEPDNWYESNCNVLKDRHAELMTAINKVDFNHKEIREKYSLEYTSVGLYTLALTDTLGRYYLHSNGRPNLEGELLANEWYQEDIRTYVVYGMGLGYHVEALFQLDECIEIKVYESDIHVLAIALNHVNFVDMMKSGRVSISYDPDFLNFTNEISKVESDKSVFIHYASLRNIKNKLYKDKLENYFIQLSSIMNQRKMLHSNFKENILHYDYSVDKLKEECQGKKVFIVAAGPSLDKNFQLLKEVQEGSIVIATGTVYRKLLSNGIRPDYVIVTDGNARVVNQIKGYEEETIPMLVLSTAYHQFAKKYAGAKYLICQNGFEQAEEYAKKKGYGLNKTGGSVSTTALDVSIQLGASEIIFLGLDLSYPNNFVHAAGTSRRNLEDTTGLIQVKDIHDQLVYTTKVLDSYRSWIEKRVAEEKGQAIRFIDATEGGAKIAGMEIRTLREVLYDNY